MSEDLPLVTFALFAYNQDEYIREAINSAFSQTYGNAEIILSDDCSTDRTFEIMREMAVHYEGPHRVSVRRNSCNVGTALHVQNVFMESEGQLIVVAAGDDISHPDRSARLVEAWVAEGRPNGVIHSGWEVFGGVEGEIVRQPSAKKALTQCDALAGYARSHWLPAAAPTAAYTRNLFEDFPPLLGGSIIEDAPLFLRGALTGKFIAVDDILVRSRRHEGNNGTGYGFSAPHRWNRFMRSKFIAFCNMQSDLALKGDTLDPVLRSKIEERIIMVIRSAPKLLLPDYRGMGFVHKLIFFLRMTASPAVAPRVRVRVGYALSFFGFTFHRVIRRKIKTALGI